jgi:hypothetical protein
MYLDCKAHLEHVVTVPALNAGVFSVSDMCLPLYNPIPHLEIRDEWAVPTGSIVPVTGAARR